MPTTINDHLIEIPSDFGFENNERGPGAYDYLLYKGVEIITYESEAEGIYDGPFSVGPDCVDCEDLKQVRALIDGLDSETLAEWQQ